MPVKDRDRGWNKIMDNMAELRSATVVVGLLGESTYKKGESSEVSVVDYGTFNEFGTRNIHSRSFLGSTFDETNAFKDETRALARKVYSGDMSPDKALNHLGMVAQAAVQVKITEGGTPYRPNADSTVARKGSSSPLIDDGDMRRAITYEVRK